MNRLPAAVLVLLMAATARAQGAPDPIVPKAVPATPERPVTDTYQETVTVADPYRWLEDAADPEVQAWTEAQDRRTRDYLDRLPAATAVMRRTRDLMAATTPSWHDLTWKGRRLFAMERRPPKQQPFLVVLRTADDVRGERTVVDPGAIDSKGTTSIDWYVPSQDGTKVAVSLSSNGSELGAVHVFDVATRKELPDVIERVNGGTAGGSLAWTPDGSGFLYTRYPHEGERPAEDLYFWQEIWSHRLGDPVAKDVKALERELPRIAEIKLTSSDDGKWIAARVANGDGGQCAIYLRGPSGQWSQLASFSDLVYDVRFGGDGLLYALSRRTALRGRILRIPLEGEPSLAAATTLVEQGEGTIVDFQPTATLLYVEEIMGGPSRLTVRDLSGGAPREIKLLPVSSLGGMVRLAGDDLLFANESYTAPLAWWRVAGGSVAPARTALVQKSPADFRDVEVLQEVATSKDGTQVPVTVLRRKGTPQDGTSATVLTGYGGYGINITPGFQASRLLWLEQGGTLAVANIRGGGEFGEDWHRGGNLTRKQNVFDDFAAAGQMLVDKRYTSNEKLGLEGGSNGGLLMGAVLTQHPSLAKAVVSKVGIYDMLRVELHPNGAFNVTEFGSVRDPDQFKALMAYSPYHHVTKGAAYPAVLLTTGVHDPRVDPANSRKMTAMLQSATSSGLPVLLRVSQSGHGIGSSLADRVALEADTNAFLLHELGVTWKEPTPGIKKKKGRRADPAGAAHPARGGRRR